ncbi:MAG: enoyl-CoA hydratase-related protein [Anaerolineae bacterium]
MTERQFVKTDIHERIAILTIDHPPANAFNGQTMSDLNAAFWEVHEDAAVKVIIITGAGTRFFVAGADIKELAAAGAQGQGRAMIEFGQATFAMIEASRKPVIAAVNGVCLGGGMELFLSCHMRIVSSAARLGQPEINLGIIPGWGGTQRLTRQIGVARAMEIILTGDLLDAAEAQRLGLVNKVVEPGKVLDEALALAVKIASKGGLAIRASVKAICEGLKMPLADGLKLEVDEMVALLGSSDAREGFSAFVEKRPPQFSDSW